MPPQHVALAFVCDDEAPAPVIEGLNTLFLAASATPVPDVIVIAQTVVADGVLNLAPNGAFGAFAVAAANVGASGTLTVQGRTGFDFMGDVLICETDPMSGACLAGPGPSVTTMIDNAATPTFSVFASTNTTLSPDPAGQRLFLEFVDAAGDTRGSTSVAVGPGNPPGVPDTLGLISGGIALADFLSTVQIGGYPVEIQVAVGGSGAALLGIGSTGFVAVGGSGVAMGGIDDFGSIIVNDRTIDTSDALFSVEGSEAEQSDLQVGQHVLVVTDADDSAVAVVYRSLVKGPVTEIVALDAVAGTAELTVLGQRVLIDATTVLDDLSLATLAIGDLVEVSGVVNASNAIVASFLEDKPALETYKVVGTVENVAESTFSIGGLLVSYGEADSLALGVKVEVVGTVDDDGVLVAASVRIKPTEAIRAEGPLVMVDAPNRRLSLLGVTFTVRDQTEFEDGSDQDRDPLGIGDLVAGNYVEIRGYLDGATLIAAEVEREDADPRARLRGPVIAFDETIRSVTILDVPVSAQDGLTRYQNDDDELIDRERFFDLLTIGDFVKATWDNFNSTTEPVSELSLED